MPVKGGHVTEAQRKKMRAKKMGKLNPNRKTGEWEYLSKTRPVKKGEIRHHVNHDRTDSSPGNIRIITRAEHNKIHDRGGGRPRKRK